MTISSTELQTKSNLYAGNVCVVTAESKVGDDFISEGTEVMLVKLAIGSKTIWLCNYNPPVNRSDVFCVEAENLKRY